MNKIVKDAIGKIRILQESGRMNTGNVRKASSELFRQIEDKSMENVFAICEELLEQHTWALGVLAYDFAYRMKKQYNDATYDIFYHWLKTYVGGWGDCDDFCTHAFGELLRQKKSLFEKIISWTEDPDFWVRRASAVILIPAISKNDHEGLHPLEIADRLMSDTHYLVLKGYGWMLKALSQVDPSSVEAYLTKNCRQMPRVAYRYALDKFDRETRNRLLQL